MFKVLSVDEWLIIKPSDQERMVSVKEGIKERLRISGDCDKCISWMIEVDMVIKCVTQMHYNCRL